MIRGISLTQPYATLIARGSKRVETRSWSTSYRGQIAIHAAKRFAKSELIHIASCWNFCGALGRTFMARPLWETLPFGAVIAVATLFDVRPTGSFTVGEIGEFRVPPDRDAGAAYGWTESQMGDFSAGRYGWCLTDVLPLAEPIPCKGALGLWRLPDAVVAALYMQLQSMKQVVVA